MRALGLALVILSATPALADEAKKPTPVQQPAVTVSCDWLEIWATHGKGTVDPKIPPKVATKLGSIIKQNDYKLLANGSVTLTAKKGEALKLAKGTANVTLLNTVNKNAARLTIDFTAANKLNSSSTQTVSAGDWLAPSVNQSTSPTAEAHVLAVGNCK